MKDIKGFLCGGSDKTVDVNLTIFSDKCNLNHSSRDQNSREKE